jgi:hypothetical protein
MGFRRCKLVFRSHDGEARCPNLKSPDDTNPKAEHESLATSQVTTTVTQIQIPSAITTDALTTSLAKRQVGFGGYVLQRNKSCE